MILSNAPKGILTVLKDDYNDAQAIKESIKELLTYLPHHRDFTHILFGMKKSKRIIYGKVFGNLDHSLEQLIDLIIEYSLGKFKPMTSKTTQYLLNENPEHEWVESQQYPEIMFINSPFNIKQIQQASLLKKKLKYRNNILSCYKLERSLKYT